MSLSSSSGGEDNCSSNSSSVMVYVVYIAAGVAGGGRAGGMMKSECSTNEAMSIRAREIDIAVGAGVLYDNRNDIVVVAVTNTHRSMCITITER